MFFLNIFLLVKSVKAFMKISTQNKLSKFKLWFNLVINKLIDQFISINVCY